MLNQSKPDLNMQDKIAVSLFIEALLDDGYLYCFLLL